MPLHALNAPRLRLLIPLLILALAFTAAHPAHADDPEWLDARHVPVNAQADEPDPWLNLTAEALAAWRSDSPSDWTVDAAEQGVTEQSVTEQSAAEQSAASRCDQIRTSDDLQLILTDADLVRNGSGAQLCVYWDLRWGNYNALLLNQRGADDFRRTKAQLQPLLADAGIDPCLVGFWTSLDTALRRTISLQDRQDAGRRCEPEIVAHGPRSERRMDEVEESIRAAIDTAETAFRWPLTWPLRVHLYDDRDSFFDGVRVEGGDQRSTPESLKATFGVTTIIANGMMGFLVDTSNFPEPLDLRMLAAHEFAHIAQAGALGSSRNLPFFAMEGGAEYFASLVVGPEQRNLAGRYREAVNDERGNRALPLRDLVAVPDPKNERRVGAGYSRGYAAMRYLTARWGAEAFTEVTLAAAGGPPDRFLTALTRITGMNLDGFDRALSAYLRDTAPPAPPPLQASSLLSRLVTARPVGADGFAETARFTSADPTVLVLFNWTCLERTYQGQGRVIAPDGRIFASFSGSVGPGCEVGSVIRFNLDEARGGRTARSMPGTWRVELYAENALQGSVTFTIE